MVWWGVGEFVEVRKSAIAKHLKATFATRERIKWQSAQKLLQNIRITDMFLLCYDIVALSLSLYLSIVYLHLQFRIFWRFAIYFFTQAALFPPVPPPLLLQLECALNFISVHSTLTNYFDKYSGMCVCVCVWELIADCTQNAN